MNDVQNQSTTAQPSQTQLFAEQFQADAADGMLSTIRRGFKRAAKLTLIVLGVSMPHQISYLVSQCAPYLHWSHWDQAVESVGMLMIAGSVPVVGDLVIISCIEQISTKAMALRSRLRAVGIIFPVLTVSGYVNFAAPAPPMIKFLAAFLVLCILFIETLKFAKPDFAAIELMRQEIRAQVAPAPAPVKRPRFSTKREKVLHILTSEPHLQVKHIADKAGVSANYVHSIRREMRQAAEVTS
jgi:hypothetical protein